MTARQILLKIFLLLLTLPVLSRATYAQQIDIEAYIADHRVLAEILSETYGIPTSVILGVSIVESSAGTCDIAKVLNNHFGIVGKNTFINKNGHKSRYKQYDNEIESYIDFCLYVSGKKFYPRLKNKKDPRLWIHAMSKIGYSEEPEAWETKILHTIAVNHLK